MAVSNPIHRPWRLGKGQRGCWCGDQERKGPGSSVWARRPPPGTTCTHTMGRALLTGSSLSPRLCLSGLAQGKGKGLPLPALPGAILEGKSKIPSGQRVQQRQQHPQRGWKTGGQVISKSSGGSMETSSQRVLPGCTESPMGPLPFSLDSHFPASTFFLTRRLSTAKFPRSKHVFVSSLLPTALLRLPTPGPLSTGKLSGDLCTW